MYKKYFYPCTIMLSSLALVACGGSSDEEESTYSESYLQFYNGSSNSALTTMSEVDGSDLGSATYGDATSLFSAESGELELEFYRSDADDQEVNLQEMTVNLKDGEKLLLVLSGDYANPSFDEFRFEREELDDHFRLFVTSVVSDQNSYDLYMSDAGAPFSAANFLGTVNYQGFDELIYWDADTDSDNFDEGEYVLYLTEPGSDQPFYESTTINFNFDTEYVLALRTTTGAIQDNLEIDLIINSSTITPYADADASAQYRVYNSLDISSPINLTLNGNDGAGDSIELAANTLSEFSVVDFGDYRLSAIAQDESNMSFNNRLVTLNQGESKAILLYQDAESNLTSLALEESTLPQVYDHQIQVANLSPDFFEVDLYFVRKDETIETAEYHINGIDYAESRSITLPSDFYELIAVYDDNTDTQVLLDRTALVGINEEVNYILTIEKTDESATGYKISLLF